MEEMRIRRWANRLAKSKEEAVEASSVSETLMQRWIDKRVKNWMTWHVGEYVDNCGEVNLTEMAEAACEHFDDYIGEDDDIPEEYFEIAHEVGERYERYHPA